MSSAQLEPVYTRGQKVSGSNPPTTSCITVPFQKKKKKRAINRAASRLSCGEFWVLKAVRLPFSYFP